MRRLTRTNLREEAGAVLRAGVLSGDLQPGEIYSASMLAQDMGVSATPVREALLDLAAAGLVEPVRNRGFRILTVAQDDLDEIIELRMMVEVPAMALVVERHAADLDGLDPVVDELEAAARAGDLRRFMLADRAFHLKLLEATGNRRLVRVVEGLRDQTRLVGLKGIADAGKLLETALEHRPILEAVRAGDATRAQGLMMAHLSHARGEWAGRAERGEVAAPVA
ncbi:MAG: GntR family transcriptional regulator [Actinobacteria bacterium]|nr:GntR family transcriptional regulator [Actinomycetota bacterium]